MVTGGVPLGLHPTCMYSVVDTPYLLLVAAAVQNETKDKTSAS